MTSMSLLLNATAVITNQDVDPGGVGAENLEGVRVCLTP